MEFIYIYFVCQVSSVVQNSPIEDDFIMRRVPTVWNCGVCVCFMFCMYVCVGGVGCNELVVKPVERVKLP